MKLSKRLLSIFLCFVMVFTIFQGTLISASAKVVGPDNKTELTITTDKPKYSWDETIVFNVEVKNVSDEVLTGVKINHMPRNGLKLLQESDAPIIPRLEPGETKIVEIEYYATRLTGFVAIFFPIMWLCNPALRILYKKTNFNYEQKVKIGASKYRIGFEVLYNQVSEEKGLTIVKDDFEYDEESNIYSFVDVIDSLNGTLTNAVNVKKLTFNVKDSKDNLLDFGEISVNECWSTTDIDFMLGENKLSVIAEYNDGDIVSENVYINCYSDAYMENLKIDTETDTDGDKLVDYLEDNYTNTDINKVDTDEDGLSDYEEVYLFNYSPLTQDSDNDGTIDADEDYDLDKISNIDEIIKGLDPTFNDSDFDALNDYDEINIYLTDPLKKDTDGDEVSDGDEVRIGTNPLKKESKFIETQEYGEITENSPVSVEVSAELKGNQVGSLNINTVTYSDNKMISPTIPGYLGVAYDFSVEDQINSAEITFNYDTSLGQIGDEFQPRIYYFNETINMFEELPNQKVENGKVIAEVEHFSTYILLNKIEFDKVWDKEIKPINYQGDDKKGIDVVFVIDSSGSMTSNDKNNIRKLAVKEFVDKLGVTDRAAIVDFDSSAYLYQGFTSDHDLLYAAINNVDSYGGTNLSKGMSKAIDLFDSANYTRTDAYKYIVFLTDGDGSYSTTYTQHASNNNITVYTIGLGAGVDESVLRGIADGTGGKYYFASAATDLPDIYKDVSLETVDYVTDSNNDGISDYYTNLIYTGELVLSNGSDEFMGINFNYGESQDPNVLCADLDGDGLLNGEELIVCENGGAVYLKMISDPCMVHSDSDMFNDYEEINNDSNPLIPSYKSDALDFLLNDSNYTYHEIFEGESNWLNTISRNIWATITLNWSHKDEAQGMVTNFLKEQSKLENIESIANETEKEMGTNLAMQAIDFATEDINEKVLENGGTIWDVVDATDKFAHLKINMKKWVSSGNSAKNLSNNWWTQFKAHVSLYNRWSKSWNWVSKVGNVMNYLPVVGVTLEEIGDIATVAKTYSTLAATSENFIVFEDILSTIVNNDNMDEKYVAKGVQPILDSIRNSKHKFTNDICRDISVASSENLASIAVTLLSVHNPLLIAINIIVGLIDSFWLGDITEGAYALYVVKEMVNASKSLINYESGYSYSSFEESEKIYLRFIYSSRIEGGKYAKQIVNKQIFIGKKASEARAIIGQYIDSENKVMNSSYYMLNLHE